MFGFRFVQARGRRVNNWTLLVGQTVQVWRGDDIVDQGMVEAVTPDGSILWLTQRGAIERRMVTKERGTGLRVQLIN
ncbi:hypothetical protein FQP90_05770 [Paenarthrobacter nitroguajacolicus]|uniref:Uncharacterized protein n=1 Tax=Paenarthrobacter nitroguajacolicus TaxID=211146 RepID=A0A558H708_PAENT|nr:hypothetical protein FQP90_05770 [Paenarthrobacter nitroguajacolicus]